MTHELASKTKAWTTLRGRETVALGRELLGGNGIVSDFLVSFWTAGLTGFELALLKQGVPPLIPA